MEKVAIYCRLSEEDRNKKFETDDSNSIQNQKAMLLEYSIEQGWEVYNIYSDDNYTGSDRNRPEFVRLLEDAKARKFDIILCKSQSRFTRELELVERYINGLFPIWGIRFVSRFFVFEQIFVPFRIRREISGFNDTEFIKRKFVF